MPDINTADDKAVAALIEKDQAALGAVIDKYTAYVGTVVWNIVEGRLGKPEAEEIISDVFLALWNNADKVQAGKLKSYLAVIARRKALNALRNAKFDVSLDDDVLELPTEGPEDETVREAEYAALRDAVNEMGEPDRTVFVMHYWFCRKTAEIALALGLSKSTVESKLWRGREKLRLKLTKGGYFDE